MRDWYRSYAAQGLIVIGVHSPEFPYERQPENVTRAIEELDIPYPVALDNDFHNWNAFRVWAWPTLFLLDKQGHIRYTHIGEGGYAETEQIIVQLLKEA